MTGEITPTRSYNVRENDRRFDRWTNSLVDPKKGLYIFIKTLSNNYIKFKVDYNKKYI